jgi:hypothetical protein
VELDAGAIAYANELLGPGTATVRFYQKNALRFHAPQSYDLIWSAGLFDYLSDSLEWHVDKGKNG